MKNFEVMLEKYADIILNIGLGLRKEQRLYITADIRDASLVRILTDKAYRIGVPYVDVLWLDEKLMRIRFERANSESLIEIPQWPIDREHEYGKRGDAYLGILSDDPDLLEGIDPQLIASYRKARAEKYQPTYKYIDDNTQTWCLAATSSPAWAKKVFPKLTPAKAEEKLWTSIFESCRVDTDDPLQTWREHNENLKKRCQYLNDKSYASLHYTAAGTDLTLGLPKDHRWMGGSSTTVGGIEFFPNLPTEEIFCLPHREKAEGYVSSSMPLILSGTVIDKFTVTFENGRATKVTAKKGQEHIQKLLDTDENAARLGEVALVPNSSPISQRKHLFYNTLFDENAASHIALGTAYRYNMIGGSEMTKEEFIKNGGNDSLIHVDFMIGSDKMDIDGIRQDGTSEPLMRKGEWAFKV